MNLLYIVLLGLLAVQVHCEGKSGIYFPPQDTCFTNNECDSNEACLHRVCQNPCEGACGTHASCDVRDHLPYCSCDSGYTGCPIHGCVPERELISECQTSEECNENKACMNGRCTDPCSVITCGAVHQCKVSQHTASCVSTVPDPPATPVPPPLDCTLECLGNEHCPPNKACVDQHCADPCSGICGANATCSVVNQVPNCACLPSYKGNPLEGCTYDPNAGCLDSSASVTGKVKKFRIDRTKMVDWLEALLRCTNNGHRLATVMNEQELIDIKKAIRNTEIRGGHFWIGGADQLYTREWYWVTNNKMERIWKITDWMQSQPDNANERCLEYWEANQQIGYKWNDLNCAAKHHYICEYFE